MSGNLKPAHAGYRYQDIITAYFFVLGIIEKFDSVTVDKKQLDDDRFDDLQIIKKDGFKTKIQIKHSTDANKPLALSEFTNRTSANLTIDRLILTNKLATEPADEYRLCATWNAPLIEDKYHDCLIEIAENPIFDTIHSKIYRLDYEKIWPQNQTPLWKPLKNRTDFNRSDFIEFCKKFVIELELPHASSDLFSPSRVETELLTLLHEKIGIGQYPNSERKVEDVAALAIALATWARANESKLDTQEIVKHLEIRTDFGRVSQAFPLDKKYFYDRPIFRENILKLDNDKKFHILIGPPGSGKSWELTNLSEILKEDAIVARHYCYLSPNDEISERRVTTDVFFANLLAELQDSINTPFSSKIGLSADISNFENALNELASRSEKVILIIDGLDHISRVKSASSNLNDNETDIIERLASLDIPNGIKLILGTQPGEHLDPILKRREDDVSTYYIPDWTLQDTIELCKLHELDTLFSEHGIENHNEIFSLVAQKANSIPLYARYLCKGIISNLKQNPTEKPEDWLNQLPIINGDIKVYYKYLYEKISNEGRFVADLFAVIEFSITEGELKEMYPRHQARHVSAALKVFEPVFVQIEAQGGLRVFHESFRRFIREELKEQGINLVDILDPVIDWMKDKGFYENAKSYRFLLSALKNANKSNEIYDLVSFDFVSTSINYGHTVDAIQNNIAITANIASYDQNWAILVRCNELRRALHTYEQERLGGKDYWLTYGRLFGHQALSERLLFDGRPTLDYLNGMQACLIVDDMGGIAPWREYINLEMSYEDGTYLSDYFDHLTQLKTSEENTLALVQAYLSLGLGFKILRKILNYLNQFKRNQDIPVYFIKCLACRLLKNNLTKTVIRLAEKFRNYENRSLISYGLYWGLSDFYHQQHAHSYAREYAECALKLTTSPILVSQLLDYGINLNNLVIDGRKIFSINLGFDGHPEKNNLKLWVATIRILAHSDQLDKVLNRELRRIRGTGWYRCWLKFVINVFCAEKAEDYNIKEVFNILLEESHPFVGKPRACDLYAIHGTISYTIGLGLRLVKTEEEWAHILEVLKQVNLNTTTRLDREVNGPVSSDVIFNLLEPYSNIENINRYILEALKAEIEHVESNGTYYSTHAELKLKYSQILFNNNKPEAYEEWKDIGIYLTSYGFRKDITLFEIIDTVSVITHESREACLIALEKLQPLISSVLRHTDGRSTKHTPNRWFKELLDIYPEAALDVLARTIVEENFHESWPTIEALKLVANKLLDQANPLIIDSLWQTIPFEIEYENDDLTAVKERLECTLKLNTLYPQFVENRLHLLAAQVSNDVYKYNEAAIKELEVVSNNLGYPIKCQIKPKKTSSSTNYSRRDSLSKVNPDYIYPEIVPHPPEDATLGDIIKCIRLIEKTKNKNYQKLNVYLSYKLQELSIEGNGNDAERILFFYGREVFSWSEDHPLASLAQCLENAGLSDLAAIAYTLSYMKSRGNGGWSSIGGSKQKNLLLTAKSLNEDLTTKVFSEELGRRLKYTDYGAGITQSLIERLRDWGYYTEAIDCWHEAFSVIEHRLTLTKISHYFAEYRSSDPIGHDIDESLILIILLRLSEPRKSRKLATLTSFTSILKYLPNLLSKPLTWFACNSTPTSSLLLILEIIFLLEDKPFTLSKGIKDTLEIYANSSIWGAQVISRSLLDRAGLSYEAYNNINGYSGSNSQTYLPNPYIMQLDPTKSLETLSLYVPSLPSEIESFLDAELKKNFNMELMSETIELIYGRSRDVIPPVDGLTWREELFIAELNNCGQALQQDLKAEGLWSLEAEEQLVFHMLPNIESHLGIYQSRVTRPALLLPNELTNGISPITIVKNDPKYENWVQLACMETQYINEEHSFSRPNKLIKNISGLSLISQLSSLPQNFMPVKDGIENLWWTKNGEIMIHLGGGLTSLVGVSISTDMLGKDFIFTPPVELLLITPDYMPADFNEKLCLKDSQGQEFLRLRSWEVREEQISSETYTLKGMDLIVHPEIFAKLNIMYNSSLVNYQFIQSIDI
ncbi:ATP-binding protein [Acinetobacter pittii]|uniref:ATP-binding protein n=1 Tax=Acinetobacter pittii TaxID=48296 RepID=UPI00083B11D1|nr:ATP-binding protein [Acinetobacter pittii]OCZ70595.1 hypothetical protein A9F99_11060 [Acinetobacter pittii]